MVCCEYSIARCVVKTILLPKYVTHVLNFYLDNSNHATCYPGTFHVTHPFIELKLRD
jgi:hypothetical protein